MLRVLVFLQIAAALALTAPASLACGCATARQSRATVAGAAGWQGAARNAAARLNDERRPLKPVLKSDAAPSMGADGSIRSSSDRQPAQR
jgi:hypothetical protein